MQDLDGRVALITGGGGGIGRGMALAFAEAGMRVALADLEQASAARVRDELVGRGAEALAYEVDVSDRASVEQLATRIYAGFGAVHLLCNNAGVTTFAPIAELGHDDWRWVLSVNLEGVVNGLQAFLPRMLAQPGAKHVVNTASIAGVSARPGIAPYVASKYAVVGISETLRLEGREQQLGCSVLCPGNTATGIARSGRNRPDSLGGAAEAHPDVERAVDEGMDPEQVGRLVREAVCNDELYIFTHPRTRRSVERRFRAILDAFDVAEQRCSEAAAPGQEARSSRKSRSLR